MTLGPLLADGSSDSCAWTCLCCWLSRHHIGFGGQNTILAGGLSAIGAALFSIGNRKDTVVQYEAGMQAGIFRVMARGARDDIARANKLLDL